EFRPAAADQSRWSFPVPPRNQRLRQFCYAIGHAFHGPRDYNNGPRDYNNGPRDYNNRQEQKEQRGNCPPAPVHYGAFKSPAHVSSWCGVAMAASISDQLPGDVVTVPVTCTGTPPQCRSWPLTTRLPSSTTPRASGWRGAGLATEADSMALASA